MPARAFLTGAVAVEAALVAAYQIDSWQTLAAFTAALIGLVTLARYSIKAVQRLGEVHGAVRDTAIRAQRIEDALWLLIDGRTEAAKDALAGRVHFPDRRPPHLTQED